MASVTADDCVAACAIAGADRTAIAPTEQKAAKRIVWMEPARDLFAKIEVKWTRWMGCNGSDGAE